MADPQSTHEYVMGNSAREQERLKLQASIVNRWTREYLLSAGLKPGMRVLDVGTGLGDVALLAAEIVGRTGSVIGIDRDAAVLQKAATRCGAEEHLASIQFIESDVSTFQSDQPFDAVVGRYILLYQPDPAAAVRHLAQQTKQGGLLCFHEMSFGTPVRSYPAHTIFSDMLSLVGEVFRLLKINPDMGLLLAKVFSDAGLPRPDLKADVPLGGDAGSYLYGWAAETIRSLLPRIEQLGLANVAEIQIDTLAQRLEQEALERHAELVGPLQFGAWLTLP